MKVKELKQWLENFQEDEEIIITSTDDHFSCSNFELHSPYDSHEQAQEIILPIYLNNYTWEE